MREEGKAAHQGSERTTAVLEEETEAPVSMRATAERAGTRWPLTRPQVEQQERPAQRGDWA